MVAKFFSLGSRSGVCGFWILVATAALPACGDDGGNGLPDASTDTDGGSDADSDIDADTDTDTDADNDTDVDTDTDTDSDADSDGDTDSCDEVDAGTSDGCVRYVDLDVASSGDGLSWANAFKTIQEGIDAAFESVEPCGKCQVWIAEGTYYIYVDSANDTVDVKLGIELYGGFAGTETSLDERDWVAHVAKLDGHDSVAGTNRVQHVVMTNGYNVIDGIEITGGQSDTTGAGISIGGDDLIVKNVFVHDNFSSWNDSVVGGYNNIIIESSVFSNNGGVSLGMNDGIRIENCAFNDDYLGVGQTTNAVVADTSFSTGALSIISGEVEISGCEIDGGGNIGIHVEEDSVVTVDNCYVENCSIGLLVEDSVVSVSGTVFTDNEETTSMGLGGAATLESVGVGDATFTNCIFYNNTGLWSDFTGGGALVGNATIDNCVFLDHEPGPGSGYIWGGFRISNSVFYKDDIQGVGEVSNSVFAGANVYSIGSFDFMNVAFAGGGLSCDSEIDALASLKNTTIMGGSYGAAIEGDCTAEIENSLIVATVWGDITASYSYVFGGLPGEGNITTGPLYVGVTETGSWSDTYFDEGLFQSELTDETASWGPGELAGLFVKVTASGPTALVTENTETAMWVWGNAASEASAGDTYEIIDLHLQPGSPAIDSGYGLSPPDFDIEGNPRYDDPSATNAYDCGTDTDCVEYVDMGAYEYQP